MKFTDSAHVGDIMNTRDIREMIQKDLEKEKQWDLTLKMQNDVSGYIKKKRKLQH